jgi:membrane associated rhomboid family serine protease
MARGTKEAERSPLARLTGAVYLAYFVTSIGTAIIQPHVPEVVGKTGNVLGYALYAVVTLLFYDLFKPVSRNVSLVAALVGLAGCLIGMLGALSILTYHVNMLFFFGPYCLLIGYLILGSRFLPHILGALMMLAGLGWLTFLIPGVAKHAAIGIEALGVAAEGLLMLWLLAMGVNVKKWQRQRRGTSERVK